MGEEYEYGGEDAGLRGGGEPVTFAWEDLKLMWNAEASKEGVQGVGVRDRNDGIGVTVKDEGRGKVASRHGVERGSETAGDVDDAADAG